MGFSHAHLANLGWMCIRYLVYQVVWLGISLARLECLGLHVLDCSLLVCTPGSTSTSVPDTDSPNVHDILGVNEPFDGINKCCRDEYYY